MKRKLCTAIRLLTALTTIIVTLTFGSVKSASAQPPQPEQAQEPPKESLAMRANRGVRIAVGPELLLPTDEGNRPAGGGVVLDGRYGLRVGPTVLAPGVRGGAYVISSRFVGTAMPTVRITVPVAFLGPYVTGGLGYGGMSNPGESGLAIRGGGGLTIHLTESVAFGAEITFEHITGTELDVLAIGPTIHLGS